MAKTIASSHFRLISMVLAIVLIASGLTVLAPSRALATTEIITNPSYVSGYKKSSNATEIVLAFESDISPSETFPMLLYKTGNPVAIASADDSTYEYPEYDVTETEFKVARPTNESIDTYYVTFGNLVSNNILVYSTLAQEINLSLTALNSNFEVGIQPQLRWSISSESTPGAIYIVDTADGTIIQKYSSYLYSGNYTISNFVNGPARTYKAFYANDANNLTNANQLTNILTESSAVSISRAPWAITLTEAESWPTENDKRYTWNTNQDITQSPYTIYLIDTETEEIISEVIPPFSTKTSTIPVPSYIDKEISFKAVIALPDENAELISDLIEVQAESNVGSTAYEEGYEISLTLDKTSYDINESVELSWAINSSDRGIPHGVTIVEKETGIVVYESRVIENSTIRDFRPLVSLYPHWNGFLEDRTYVAYIRYLENAPLTGDCYIWECPYANTATIKTYHGEGSFAVSNEIIVARNDLQGVTKSEAYHYSTSDPMPAVYFENMPELGRSLTSGKADLNYYIVDETSSKIIKSHNNGTHNETLDPYLQIGFPKEVFSGATTINYTRSYATYAVFAGSELKPIDEIEELSDIGEILFKTDSIDISREPWGLSLEVDSMDNCDRNGCSGPGFSHLVYTISANQRQESNASIAGESTYLVSESGEIISQDNGFYTFNVTSSSPDQLIIAHDSFNREPPRAVQAVKAFPRIENPKNIEDLAVVAQSNYAGAAAMNLIREKFFGGSNPANVSCEQTCAGDPVNTFTGEFFEQEQDLSIDGPMPFGFTRSFSTFRNQEEGDFGYGWRHNYAMKVIGSSASLSSSERIRIIQENGSVVEFTAIHNEYESIFIAPRDVKASLIFENGEYLYKRLGEKQTFHFDTAGKLISISDLNGNSLGLIYSGDRLLEITDQDGKTITLIWTGNRITAATANNFSVSYSYESGQLISVNPPFITGNKTYDYDSSNRIVEIAHPNGGIYLNEYDNEDRVIKQINPLAGETLFTYSSTSNRKTTTTTFDDGVTLREIHNLQGNVLEKRIQKDLWNRVEYSYTYDSFGRKITETDPVGNTTSYSYDSLGNIISVKDALNRVTRFTYDGNNQLVQIIDPLGAITTNLYDNNGNLIEAQNSNGFSSIYEVNSDGTAASFTNAEDYLEANGKKTEFSYDLNGYLNEVTSAEGRLSTSINDSTGNPLESADPLNRVTQYSYNTKNQLTSVEIPSGAENSSTYDSAGRILTTTDSLGRVTSYAYDVMDNVLSITDVYGTTAYEYDSMQKLVKQINPDNTEISYDYDYLGRIISVIDENLNETKFTYFANSLRASSEDALGNIVEYTYDAVGNLLSVETANEITVQNIYDELNRLTSSTSANGYTETYTYDSLGNVLSVTKGGIETIAYEYDANGQLRKTTYPDQTVENREYDSDGNIIKVIDRDGNEESYVYDLANQLTKIVRPDLSEEEISYTVTGQVDKTSYDSWTTIDSDFTYDISGRLIGEEKNGIATTYSYDSIGNMTRRGPPTGPGVEYDYDNYGELNKLTYPSGLELSYSYDPLGNLTKVKKGSEDLVSYQYNEINNPTKVIYGNGVEKSLSYNDFNQLASLEFSADNQNFYEKIFSYQPAGLVTSSSVQVNSNEVANDSYSYSAVQRLESTLDNLSQTTKFYSHDSSSNLISGPSSQNSFTANGKLLESLQDNDTRYYTTDARGNRVAEIVGTDVTSYGWTLDNKLSSVTLPGSIVPDVEYGYSASGLLSQRSESSTTKTFFWDESTSIPTLIEDGENLYVYGIESNPSIQIDESTDEITYLHGDERGSIIAATDDVGELLWTRAYDEYGAIVTETPQVTPASDFETNFGYAGEWQDPTTGLYNLRARWYEPETASFLSQDPALLATGEGYSYGSGDPLRHTDPLGLYSQELTAIAGFVDGFSIIPFAADVINQLQPGSVATCITAYAVGQSLGFGISLIVPGAAAAKTLLYGSKVALKAIPNVSKNIAFKFKRFQERILDSLHDETGSITLNRVKGKQYEAFIKDNYYPNAGVQESIKTSLGWRYIDLVDGNTIIETKNVLNLNTRSYKKQLSKDWEIINDPGNSYNNILWIYNGKRYEKGIDKLKSYARSNGIQVTFVRRNF